MSSFPETPHIRPDQLDARSVSEWLDGHGDLPEAQPVLRSWLESGGDPAVVGPHLDRWLGLHGSEPDSQFVMKAWLEAGGELRLVGRHLTAWLKSHGMADDAGFVLTAWLKAGGDKDFVQRQVAEWLEAHDTRSEASFVLTAWLDTGVKKKKLIQPHVLRWLARHDREEEASFVLSSWLRGEGEPALVRSHVRSWLAENADGPEAGLLIRRWLQAEGDFELVREPALALFRAAQSGDPRSSFMSKFLARQPDLPSEVVRELLAWCRSVPGHPDAVSRLASLGDKLARPELLEEVELTCKVIVDEMLGSSGPSLEQRALLAILFGVLGSTSELRSRTGGLFLRWLRSPASLRFQGLEGRSASLAVQAQRIELIYHLLDVAGTGELSTVRDAEPLRRFFDWVMTWSPSKRNRVRKLLEARASGIQIAFSDTAKEDGLMATGTKSQRVVYHVVPNSSAEKWLVTQENASFRREFETKEEALEEAKRLAKSAELGQVKVHKKDGNMEYENTYGEDPPETPG